MGGNGRGMKDFDSEKIIVVFISQVDDLFQEVGVNKDGMINYEEFVKLLARK